MNCRVSRTAPLFPILLLFILSSGLSAQDRTVGVLLNTDDAFAGYTLFSGLRSKTTYLIDMEGRIVRSWESGYTPGDAVYLLEDGHLLHTGDVGGEDGDFGVTGGSGGIVQEYDWEGNLVWEYRYANDSVRQHHDAIKLPSGNVLMIAWELVSVEEAVALGRDPSTIPDDGLWVDHLGEVKPIGSDGGEIVWEWHMLDHLVQDYDDAKENFGVVADHPELMDFNRTAGRNANEDWMHVNGLDYNEELDQVVFSSPTLNEILIIDHSTTTEEAAGHSGGTSGRGGDLIYRWGNPAGYGAGSGDDQQLFFQHNPHWIPEGHPGAGNILVFDNGQGRPDGQYSSVVEIVPPLQEDGSYSHTSGLPYGPSEPIWTYVASNPTDFYSGTISSAQRLPNGNTLVCAGENGWFFELTSDGEIVWEYINPVTASGILDQGESPDRKPNPVFRAVRYAPDYAAFTGRDLTPGDFIEGYPSGVEEEFPATGPLSLSVAPNPAVDNVTISIYLHKGATATLSIANVLGENVRTLLNDEPMPPGERSFQVALTSLPSGTYVCRLAINGVAVADKVFTRH